MKLGLFESWTHGDTTMGSHSYVNNIYDCSKYSPNMSRTDDNDDDVSHSVQSSDIYLRSGMRYLICVPKGISMGLYL